MSASYGPLPDFPADAIDNVPEFLAAAGALLAHDWFTPVPMSEHRHPRANLPDRFPGDSSDEIAAEMGERDEG